MLSEPYRLVAINFPSEERNEKSRVSMRLRIEYGPEGGGDPKAIEVHVVGDVRELTYEGMDEVLKADISEAELEAITRLLNSAGLTPEHVPCALADAISLSYKTGKNQRKCFWGEMGSQQFDALLDIWIALERLARRYFIPRFY
jgi:hypothetical protein